MNTETEYTNKQKLESQGFIRTRHGVYKLTALEQIYRKGCLEYSETTYGGQDRLRAGAAVLQGQRYPLCQDLAARSPRSEAGEAGGHPGSAREDQKNDG